MQAFQEILAKKQALEAQQADITKQLAEAEAKWRETRIAEVRHMMETYGVTLEDLGSAAGRKAGKGHANKLKGRKVPAKYRGMSGEEWSGRGREPAWIKGQDRAQFAVQSTHPQEVSI